MITWHSPWAFLLFIPLVLIVAWVIYNRKQRLPSILFSGLSDLRRTPRSLRSRLTVIPFLIKLLALSLAIIALARPQRADTKIKKNVEGIDIVIALDISDSMLIEDMTPENRLESSKETIKKFVEGRVSDRIGLVVFSGESYTRVPLTLDYPLYLQSL
ncbi:MAG: BatA domain-containing protein, partial [Bdellovibrionales bacterium]|nr:BatA domain-containing protein [Bdellovibrionales bacterium]